MQSDRPAPGPRSDDQRRIRYNHLVERLRNRQVTMEEATELFGLLQESLASAGQAMRQMTPPPPPRPGPRVVTSPSPAAGTGGLALRDEDLALGILAVGAGAGLLAAILKRSAEGPRTTGSK